MSDNRPSAFHHMVSNPDDLGGILNSPSAERNFQPICDVLAEILPPTGKALEVASGTGLHICGFAAMFPNIDWHPNDLDRDARASIAARRAQAGFDNFAQPTGHDMTDASWFKAFAPPFSALLAINIIHIAPWSACLGVLDGAAALLEPGGVVYLYGCFSRAEKHLSQSNITFDQHLKSRDSRWGVRDTDDVAAAATQRGLALEQIIEMPANNLSLVLRRV